MKPIQRSCPVLCLLFITAVAQGAEEQKSYAELTTGLVSHEGFLTTLVDDEKGTILTIVPDSKPDFRFLYQSYLAQGLGSNPVGLDRTFGGDTAIIRATRRGDRVFFEVENWRYQARDGGVQEKAAVAGSFATSVVWSTPVLARGPEGGWLIDLKGFLLRDAVGVVARLKAAEQGDFSIDADRSYVDTGATLVFPKNVELEAALTFATSSAGDEVTATAPVADSATLRVHHSFSELPAPGYAPRAFDPRTGGIEHTWFDFATPLSAPITTKMVRRHRLELDGQGRVVEPIVYYIDSGAPEPLRQALVDGARWWSEAFDDAGFPGGFRVEVLPEDIHPLDIRYNVVTWVHRATRGWSYGASVVDPRTGEIVKGFVLLGSQRVRQDRLIFEGLAGVGKTGTGADDDPVELALDRIRQLSAHEVGHTIGLAHNFAASTYDRGSVMDYPAPWVRVTDDGVLDFSQAYATGAGVWDRFTIKWLYNDTVDHEALIADADAQGWIYVTDRHGRGTGTAHPKAAVWDNGADPIAALEEALAVRKIALENFGLDRIADGEEVSQLARVLVPIYLYHRYQVDAAAKSIAGYDYQYAVRGDGRSGPIPVDATKQRAALSAVLRALDPAEIVMPERIATLITPFSTGYTADPITERELFKGRAEPIFDAVVPVAQAAAIAVNALLAPERATRLTQAPAGAPGLLEVIQKAREVAFDAPRSESESVARARRAVQAELVAGLIALADAAEAAEQARAISQAALEDLARNLERSRGSDDAQVAHKKLLARSIRQFLNRDMQPIATPPALASPPPGSPIGQGEECWHCESQ